MPVLATITGGRPMKKVCYAFHDVVEHKPVFIWIDRLGRFWMANNKWGWFRVRTQHPEVCTNGS